MCVCVGGWVGGWVCICVRACVLSVYTLKLFTYPLRRLLFEKVVTVFLHVT